MLLWTALSLSALASTPVELDVALARDLGDGLFQSGDAAGALQWYRTARWLEPSADELPGVQLRVGMGLEAGGDYSGALDWYRRVDLGDDRLARLRAGVCVFRAGSARRGDGELQALGTDAPELRPTVDMVRGALWVQEGDLKQAERAFAAVPSSHPQGATAAGLAAYAGAPPHEKNPAIAATMSVLPGVGQMYVGDWLPGVRNLLLVGLAGGGAWWTAQQGAATESAWMMGMSGALTTAGAAGWAVNVGGAWRRAEDAAAAARQAHAAELGERVERLLPEIPLEPAPAQLEGGWTGRP